jgi:hypothetical protein
MWRLPPRPKARLQQEHLLLRDYPSKLEVRPPLGHFSAAFLMTSRTAARAPPTIMRFTQDTRFLIVRPTGGITDMLNTIADCISYCRTNRRFLAIDTDISDFFAEDFSNYFSLAKSFDGVTALDDHLGNLLNASTTYPRQIQGRLFTYKAAQIPREFRSEISKHLGHFTNLWDSDTRCPLTFDMRREYSETVLLHHCSGGGTDKSLEALSFLRATATLKESIRSGLQKLPATYSAIHVRNTDLKSDLDAVYNKIREIGDTDILICSDDPQLIFTLRNNSDASRLHSLSEHATYNRDDTKLHTLHKNSPDLPRHDVNTNMFVELIAMALSDEFFAAPLLDNRIKSISGFSELVEGMRKNKRMIAQFL